MLEMVILIKSVFSSPSPDNERLRRLRITSNKIMSCFGLKFITF